jgi:hypothetical protein
MDEENKTVLEVITELTKKDHSDDTDSMTVQYLLRKMGFNNAVVTCGIVYLEGYGTISSPPVDIHTIAKMLYEALQKLNLA